MHCLAAMATTSWRAAPAMTCFRAGTTTMFSMAARAPTTSDGGMGFDIASYENAVSSVQVNLALGRGTVGEALGDVLVSIEGLIGSDYADTLIGDGASNLLRGGAGGRYPHGRVRRRRVSVRAQRSAGRARHHHRLRNRCRQQRHPGLSWSHRRRHRTGQRPGRQTRISVLDPLSAATFWCSAAHPPTCPVHLLFT